MKHNWYIIEGYKASQDVCRVIIHTAIYLWLIKTYFTRNIFPREVLALECPENPEEMVLGTTWIVIQYRVKFFNYTRLSYPLRQHKCFSLHKRLIIPQKKLLLKLTLTISCSISCIISPTISNGLNFLSRTSFWCTNWSRYPLLLFLKRKRVSWSYIKWYSSIENTCSI